MRQAIFRNRNCLWFDRDSSPKTSMYCSRSWLTVIWASSSICCETSEPKSFSFLGAVNLVSMRARSVGTIKGKFATPTFAVPEVASGQDRGDGLQIVFK